MTAKSKLHRRETETANGVNVWFSHHPGGDANYETLSGLLDHRIEPVVIGSELEVGRAMLHELETLAGGKDGDVVILLLGGRGAQAFHSLLGERARRGNDEMISRLRVFTQDALAPLRMQSGLSFVRDFERLLGDDFFRQVKSFTTVRTDAADLETEVARFVDDLEAAGAVDIFFLGHGPESNDASHLAYIKPGSGAMANDISGLIPISSTILEHHITKFKAGGSAISEADEAECRRATTIFTLGPAAILRAKRIVQSIVDADTAPAKKRTYRRVMETSLPDDPAERARMLDSNPGLWIRLHPNVRSLVLPNVLS